MIFFVSNVNKKDMDVNKLINAENIQVYITHSHKVFSPGALFFGTTRNIVDLGSPETRPSFK